MSIRSQETFAELLAKPDEVTKAIRGAVREALIEHYKAGQPVVVWRDGKTIEIRVDANGDEIGVL